MTPEAKERLARYLRDNDDFIQVYGEEYCTAMETYASDLEAERAEVVRINSEACNSASNPGAHRLALKNLTAMGERVPAKESQQ